MGRQKYDPKWFEKRIAEHVWKTYNSIEDKNRALIEFYQQASREIREELYTIAEKIAKDGVISRTEMYRQQRLQKLEKRYLKIAYELGKQVEKFAKENIMDGYLEVYENAAVVLDVPNFALPDKKLMEKLMNEPWRGSDFSSRLWENQEKLTKALNNVIRTGLQQGITVTDMAIELNYIMGKGFNAAHRLVRTETMHYLNGAAVRSYEDAGVEKVQFWAAKDERTCDICGAMHEKIYDIKKAPVLPIHPNCRCTYLPVMEDDEISEEISEKNVENYYDSATMESGARITDIFSKEADDFAEMYYKEIRSFSTDVRKIANNLRKNEEDIRKIKAYLFEDDSLFDPDSGKWRRFDPDCAIAQSWQRLMIGKNIKPHDKTLIEHELLEMDIKEKNPGISHQKAHEMASQEYDYGKEAEVYYGNLEKHSKNKK